MRQRVMIAMALLVEPDLLVADECTTALDATVEAQIVALLEDLARKRRAAPSFLAPPRGGGRRNAAALGALGSDFTGSIVFISHHLGLVAQLCDDVCVMYAGTVVETGPMAAVLARPRHPYTRALIDCELDDHAHGGRLVSIPGEVTDPLAPQVGCTFAPRCTHAAEVCRTTIPLLRNAGPDRRAACHLFEQIAAAVP